MNNDFYFTILQRASEKGILKYVDVSDEIKNHFLNNNNIPDILYTTLNKNVDIFLDRFKETKHLIFKNETPEINFASNTDCLNHIKAEVAITPTGVLFLYEQKKIDGMLIANKLTRYFIYSTVILGALTFLVSFKTMKLQQEANNINNKTSQLQNSIERQSAHIKVLQQDSFQIHSLYQGKAAILKKR